MKNILFCNPVRQFVQTMVVASCLWACSPASTSSQLSIAVLDMAQIYEVDAVKDFVFACEETNLDQQKETAKKDFLKAIDYRENQKNGQEAIQYFKKAAAVLPDANTYFELGSTLLALNQNEEARKAFEVAEALRFTPAANLHYKKAQVTALLKENEYVVVDYLKKAVEQGFSDKSAIDKEIAFDSVRNTEQFQLFYVKNFSQGISKPSAEFKLFLRGFPAALDNFEVKANDVAEVSDKYISYEFASYVREMETRQDFGREVGSEYFYVAKVRETPEYAAVLYAAKDAVAESVPPVFTYLVTYNWEGQEISKINFACQCTPKSIKTGKIEGDKVTVVAYDRQWQAEFTDVPPSENKIKSINETEKRTYEIAANGKITETTTKISAVKEKSSWFSMR